MTGKEEYYKRTTCVKRGSKECVDALWRLALKDCAKEYWLGVRRMAEQVLDDLDELTKYERAFEIFKKYNTFTMVGRNKDDEDYVISTIRNLMFLDKEEYELLEELMKDENC